MTAQSPPPLQPSGVLGSERLSRRNPGRLPARLREGWFGCDEQGVALFVMSAAPSRARGRGSQPRSRRGRPQVLTPERTKACYEATIHLTAINTWLRDLRNTA